MRHGQTLFLDNTFSGVMYMLATLQVPLWAQILLDGPSLTQSASHERAKTSCLVLLAHGSKDPRWREPFEKMFLRSRKNSDRVKLAYMEFSSPTLLEVAEECRANGIETIRVLPLFMAAGAHLATDIPEQAAQIRAKFQDMQVEVMPPIGEDPRVSSLLGRIIQEQLERI